MNKIYNLVWSSITGNWCCVAEITKARGKSSRSGARSAGLLSLAVATGTLAAPPPPAANQLPTGGQVVAGQATVSTNNAAAQLTVRQGTERAAINWQSFSIGSAAKVEFQQPSANSVALNRVIGADPSQIFGKLSANGSVYLTNPNGVLFAPGAQVDVGGLVATTMGITNADFMAGKAAFTRNGSTASVINQAELTAGNFVALLAPEVRNEGVIIAQATVLAAGEAITLSFGADSKLADISVTPAQIRTLVENRQAILAEGGQIILASRAADKLAGSVVNSGTLSASSITEHGGVIRIEADSITLADSSKISADGTSGGTIQVGSMATHDTRAAGTLSARGSSGAGGFIETSAQYLGLDAGVRVDTTGATATGNWLLDPYDLTVGSTDAATISTNLGSTSVTLQTTASGTAGPGTANASGSGDITINSAISWSSANTLTLDAYRSININALVTASGAGKVVMKTNDGGSGGDYSFGLSSSGFAGSLRFTGAAGGGQALTINGASYTLIYDMTAGANGFKSITGATNYALAKPITGGASTTSVATGTFTGIFTGLGNTIDSLALAPTTSNTALFTQMNGTVRDFGLTNATLLPTANSQSNYALVAATSSGGTFKNDYVTGTLDLTGQTADNGPAAPLVATFNYGTIDNSFSTATVKARGGHVGGLVGAVSLSSAGNSRTATISNSYATGNVSSINAQYLGGLIGSIQYGNPTSDATVVTNSYATGTVTAATSGTYVGGLIGFASAYGSGSTLSVSNSYATGAVTNVGTETGGFMGTVNGNVTINNSYATGAVTSSGNNLGGFIGSVQNTSGVTISNSYAKGNVTGTSAATSVGGFIGDAANTTINTSFSSGNVTAYSYAGGFIGATRTTVTLNDVYETGNVIANNAFAGDCCFGGLLGYIGGTTVVKNAYASGTVPTADATQVGGLVGTSSSNLNITNGYWDSTTQGATGYGSAGATVTGGGALTDATLKSGTMPTGFNSGNTSNGTPWVAVSGITPFFNFAAPAGLQSISGTAYTSAGATANSGSVYLYINGSLVNSAAVSTNSSNGTYTAYVGPGTISASTKLGGSLILSGGSAVTGASYTDSPSYASNAITGFDIKSGLFLVTTADTTSSALNTNMNTVFGTATLTSINSATASATRQINAGGAFTLDTALTQTGGVGIKAGGDIAINAALATSGTMRLESSGNITDGASGSVAAAGLVLTGGNAVLDSTSNSVTTLAASGMTGLFYQAGNSVTIGSVGPYTTGITASAINGSGTATTTGLTATTAGGDLTVKAIAGVTVAGVPIRTNGGDITLWSNSADATTGGVQIQDNSTLDSRASTDRTAGNIATASGGGSITLAGGSASTTLASGTVVPTGYATNVSGGAAGVLLGTNNTDGHDALVSIYSGGGDVMMRGNGTNSTVSNASNGVKAYEGLTIDGGTTGSITMIGQSSYATGYGQGIELAYSTVGAFGLNSTLLRTTNGNITLTGTSTNGIVYNNGVEIWTSPTKPTTLAVTGTGSLTINGSGTGGSAGARNLVLGAVDLLAASGPITLNGTGPGQLLSTSHTGTYQGSVGSKAGSLVTSSSSNVVMTDNDFAIGATNGFAVNTTGTLTAQPTGNNFTTVFNFSPIVPASTVSALTVGRDIGATAHTDTINMNGAAQTIAGPISIYGGIENISTPLVSTASGGTITLKATTSATESGTSVLTADNLLLSGGGTFALNQTGNNVGTLAAGTVGNVSYVDSNALTIGTVGSTSGITSTGTVAVSTQTGDMALTQAVTTSNTTSTAIVLTAGASASSTAPKAVGTDTSGNIVVSGSGAVNLTGGGAARATLYSGSVSNSTGLSTLAGSSRSRYGSSATVTSFTTALSAGKYAVYREQPAVTITANSYSVNYGDADPAFLYTGTGMINGDSASSTLNGYSVVVPYNTSGAGYANAGVTPIQISASSRLGYALTFVNGTYTVAPKSISVAGLTASNKVYDGTTTATLGSSGASYSGVLAGDDVNANPLVGTFANKNVGTGKTVTVSGSFGGDDGGNYVLASANSPTADITPASLVLSTSNVSKVYDGGLSAAGAAIVSSGTLYGSDSLSGGSFAYTDKNVGAGNKTVSVSGVTVSDGNGGANYSVSYQANTTSTITPKALTISGVTAQDKVYDGTTAATVNATSGSYSGLVAGDIVTVGTSGSFDTKNVGTGKTVTLSGSYGGADAGNYTISGPATATASITPKSLTVSGITAADKTYDGTTAATVNGSSVAFGGIVSGDNVTLASSSGSFSDKNAGSGKTVTLTNSFGGSDAGNYSFVDQASTTAAIAKAAITLASSDASKVYDGGTSVTGGSIVVASGTLYGSDSVTSATRAYDNKNVGAGTKTVSTSGAVISDGNSGGNYTVSYADNTTSTITPKALTVSGITAADKVYDGNTGATISSFGAVYGGLVSGDVVSVSATGNFVDANAGSGKTVNLTSSYGGADAGNYTIGGQATTTASIGKAALTVTANADARFVTQADTAGYNGVQYSGFVGGDTSASLNTSGLTISRANASTNVAAGIYANTLLPSGVSATNYAISYAAGDYTILAANNALVKTVNVDVGYGSTPSYTVSTVQYLNGSNVLSTLTQTGHSGNSFTYSDGAGGTLAFTLSPAGTTASTGGRVNVGNYAIQDAAPVIGGGNLVGAVNFVGNQAVQQAAVSVAAGGVSKVYDGNTSMNGLTLNLGGQLAGDVLSVSGSGAFAQKNVGSGLAYTVSGMSLGGADAGNYYLSGGTSLAGTNGTITPKAVTVSGIQASNKVYDGTTAATVTTTNAQLAGIVTGDDVGVSASGVFSDKNVAAGKTVTLTSSYAGADAGNYAFTDQATTTASITPKALTVSGLTAADKVYDGTTTAAVSTGAAAFSGLVSGDVLTVSASGNFSDRHVGAAKSVTLTSSYGGADVGNYTITGQAGTTASITPAALTISTASQSKVYDGGTSASGATALVVGGTLYGTDALSGGSFAYTDKNVGSGNKTVTVGGVTVNDGHGGGDYTVSYVNNTTSTITPKALTVGGISAADKIYDGTTSATVSSAGLTLGGLVSGDDVTLASTSGSFVDKNAGSGKTVTLTNALAGGDLGNYMVSNQASTTASISKASLVLSTADVSKVYDGNTTAPGAALLAVNGTQLFGTDTASGGSFAYTNKNVGAGNKTVTVAGGTINDGNSGGNYDVSYVANTTSTITPKALSVTGLSVADRVYDGTAVAVVNSAGASYTGLVSGDSVILAATGSFADKNVGNAKAVTINSSYSGADAGNYTISSQGGTTASITPKALTISGITAADKVYDGTTTATVASGGAVFGGMVAGDNLTLTSSTGSFDTRHAGSGKTVTLTNSYGGSDLGNYTLADQASTTAAITPAALILSTADVSKVYDGNTSVSGAALVAVGGTQLYGTDSVSGGSFAYTNKNAGAGSKVVTVAGATVTDGNGGSDYTVTYQNNTTSTITPKALTISGISAADKTYDATTAATVSTGAAVYGGLVSGDSVAVAATGSFSDANAGAGKTVNLTSSYSGADVGNYTIAGQATTTASIAQALLIATPNADAKFVTTADTAGYNGVHYSGFVGGDSSAVVDASGLSITRSNSGVNSAGSYGGVLVATGLTAQNYAISYTAGDYTIVAANNALVKVGNVSTGYGSGASYVPVSVQYMDGSNVISDLTQTSHTGNAYAYSDGVGGTLAFTLAPQSAVLSTGGQVNIGNYAIGAATGTLTISGGNLAGTAVFTGNHEITRTLLGTNTGGLSKVYDGSAAMTNLALTPSGAFAGDLVSASGSGAYASKNAGGGLAYTINGIALAGSDADNYYLASSTASGSNGVITPKALTVSGITAADKVYDGLVTATVNTSGASYGGLVAGDDLAVTATGSFADKNVGTGKAVTLSSSYSGTDVGNYVITGQASTTASITPKALTISGLSVANRTYDGTTIATVDTAGAVFGGIVAGDSLTVSATGSFADRNVGSGKTVTLTSTHGGADAANYTFTDQATTTADINRAAITLSSGTVSKVYDGGTSAAGSLTITSGQLFGSDTVSGGSFAFADKNVGAGNKTVNVSGATLNDGFGGGNYLVTYQANTASTITPKALLVSGLAGVDRVYNGTTAAAINSAGIVYGGRVAGDDLTLASASGSFADKNVGSSKALTVNAVYAGEDLGNYTIVTAGSTASITPRALAISGFTAADKVYDATTTATLNTGSLVYGGLVAGDSVTLQSASGAFADKNVGADKVVTITSSFNGADAGNYTISAQTATTADITVRKISVSGGMPDVNGLTKVYDGNNQWVIDTSGIVFSGLLAGDVLGYTASGTSADKNVGQNKLVTITSGFTGADAANYAFTVDFPTTGLGTITPKALVIAGLTAADKVYDGTTAATVNTAGATFTGLLAGDVLGMNASGTFADKNAGNGKTVNLGYSYAGADAGNYAISAQATTTASIAKRTITITDLPGTGGGSGGGGGGDLTKTYDGTTHVDIPTGTVVIGNVVPGETIGYTASGTTVDKNVGVDKAVTITGTITGDDAANYDFVPPAPGSSGGVFVTITPKALTVSGITAADKVYDGTTAATVDASRVQFAGLVAGDVFGVSATGSFINKNAGTNKTVNLNSSYSGADVGNYTITGQATTTASITKRTLTITDLPGTGGTGGPDLTKTYDGTTHVDIPTGGITIGGLLPGETVGYTATGNTSDKNVGVDKPVTVTGVLTGDDAGNYDVVPPAPGSNGGVVVTITPKALTISGITADNKVYDRTTAATVNTGGIVYAGLIAGDLLSISSSTGSFVNKNAGVGKTVNLLNVYGGADLQNYAIADQTTTTANITPRTVVVDGLPGSNGGNTTLPNKTYDGTTNVPIDTGGTTIIGLIPGDDVGATATGNTPDKNVGPNRPVTIVPGLDGDDAGNYQIVPGGNTGTVTVTVVPRLITVDGTVVVTKVHDGNTDATLTGAVLTPGGVIAGDDLTLTNSTKGQFNTPDIGTGKPVSTSMGLGGDDAGNYTIVQPTGLTGTIVDGTGTVIVRPPELPPTGVPVVPELPPAGGNPPPVLNPGTDGNLPGGNPTTPPVNPTGPQGGTGTGPIVDPGTGAGGGAQPGDLTPNVPSLQLLGTSYNTDEQGGGFISVLNFDPLDIQAGVRTGVALPLNTFTHSDPTALITYEARKADDSPLPDWLSFDGQTLRFSGTPPGNADDLDVVIIARDKAGHEARTRLKLKVKK